MSCRFSSPHLSLRALVASAFYLFSFVVVTREKWLMNSGATAAIAALTVEHRRHSDSHKSRKDEAMS